VPLELASSVTLIVLFSFRIITNATSIMTIRNTDAPPIMPPSSGFVSPLLEVAELVGNVFGMAVLVTGMADSLATTPPNKVVVGAPTTVSEVMVVVMVRTTEFESVVLIVSVTVNVTGAVE